jgi:glycosyltransferase involved in cell wall biosynthesis
MRILHVSNSAAPAGGGPIESIRQAHRALTPQGHTVDLVCLDPPDAPWLRELEPKTVALGPAVTPYRYSPRYVPWLKWNADAYDAVILHGIWLYPSFGAWLVLPGLKVPYFIYAHGLLDPGLKDVFPLKHLKKTLAWKLIEHRVVRDARAVFFTGQEEQTLAHRSFKPFLCNPAIVPYCVGDPEGDPAAQRAAFLDRFPQCRDRTLLLFLSRIHPKKGCDLLLDAFAGVAAEHPSLQLVMAGPDSIGWQKTLEDRARKLGIADRVVWTGMLSGALKWGAFRAADAFILPSHQENFGIAVAEALACGVPVLTTDKVNIWREIKEDQAGLIGSDDPAGTRDLLARWLALPAAARDAMRHAARTGFTSRFRAAEAAEILLRTLRLNGVRDREATKTP